MFNRRRRIYGDPLVMDPERDAFDTASARASQLIEVLTPPTIGTLENEVRTGDRLDFRVLESRLVDTPRFVGHVAVEFFNDDGNINPGYERGTVSTLHVQGAYEDSLFAMHADRYGRPIDPRPTLLASRQAVSVLDHILTVVQRDPSTEQ